MLVVGDSHLQAFVDEAVIIPEGKLSFGFISTPGACASELNVELVNDTFSRTCDAVCVMAPGNNLTANKTCSESGVDFAALLSSVCSRWSNVSVCF